MEEFLAQIRKTLDSGSYYATLFMCLCVPDICAALQAPDGRTNGARYEAWFNANVTTELARTGGYNISYAPKFDGHEAYLLRCAALHQGQLANTGTGGKPGSKYTKIIFQEPSRGIMHLGTMDEAGGMALVLNLVEFCNDMLVSAYTWLATVRGTEPFESNYALMFKRYPNGLSPLIVGVPVIS